MAYQQHGQGQGRRRDRQSSPRDSVGPEMIERVVQINHVAKVVKGGRRFGFSTVVVVGDGKGSVGASIGKAKEVPESISKGRSGALKSMKKIKIVNGTIPHEIVGECGATRVLLRPAVPGTGIIAGKSVRAILEATGIRDVLSKTLGSSNAVNVVKATMDGLTRLQLPEEVAEIRGKTVGEIFVAHRVRRQIKMDEELAASAKAASLEQSSQPSGGQPGKRRDFNRPSGQGQGQRPGGGRPRGGPDNRGPDRRPDRRPSTPPARPEGTTAVVDPSAPGSPSAPAGGAS